jgi:hypothetical protein
MHDVPGCAREIRGPPPQLLAAQAVDDLLADRKKPPLRVTPSAGARALEGKVSRGALSLALPVRMSLSAWTLALSNAATGTRPARRPQYDRSNNSISPRGTLPAIQLPRTASLAMNAHAAEVDAFRPKEELTSVRRPWAAAGPEPTRTCERRHAGPRRLQPINGHWSRRRLALQPEKALSSQCARAGGHGVAIRTRFRSRPDSRRRYGGIRGADHRRTGLHRGCRRGVRARRVRAARAGGRRLLEHELTHVVQQDSEVAR